MTGSWFPNGAKINSDFVLTFAVKKEHWFQNINKLAEVIFSDHLEREKKKSRYFKNRGREMKHLSL